MWKKTLSFLFIFCLIWHTAFAGVKTVDEQRKEWNEWLSQLKQEMIDKGISKKTIREAYKNDYFHEIKQVEIQDKKQAEFIHPRKKIH